MLYTSFQIKKSSNTANDPANFGCLAELKYYFAMVNLKQIFSNPFVS